jgi:hypothetical protein
MSREFGLVIDASCTSIKGFFSSYATDRSMHGLLFCFYLGLLLYILYMMRVFKYALNRVPINALK